MTRPLALLFACLLLVAFAGCGDDDKEASANATPTATATPEDTGGEQGTGCQPADKPAPKDVKLKKPKQELDPAKTYVATVTTNCGDFKIKLDAKRAPKTGGSFKYLVDKGVYDGLGFHRIVPGFVIQGGDPLGNGTGGPGYSVDEKPPANLAYTKGIVAMAKSSAEPPGRSGSQFYVVTAPDAGLPPEYALVGKVSEGYDVVEKIDALGTPEEQPNQTVLIEAMTVEQG
jgi:peptidyl-prolyl cis-trans isomerase B (cyclophilin B)